MPHTSVAAPPRPPQRTPSCAHGTDWDEARTLARQLGLRRVSAMGHVVETVPLGAAAGRLLAADVVAGTSLPRCDTAAMDGWVLAASTGPSACDSITRWALGDTIAAGDLPSGAPMPAGTARPISTGAAIPAGAVAVLRSEQGDVIGNRSGAQWLLSAHPVAAGDHIRPAGEEARVGDVLLRAPVVLTAPRIALAAASGQDSLTVRRIPTLAVLVLGDELVRSGQPRDGRVRDVLGPVLPTIGATLGLGDGGVQHVPDDRTATIAALGACAADVVVTTGGSSRGAADHMRPALEALGARMVFDGVRMRPGHPVMLAELPDGRPVLSLPGNPLAALLCLASFGVPLADAMLGRPPLVPVSEVLADEIANATGSVRLAACRREITGLSPVGWQGSGMLRGLADADTVAVIPPGGLRTGEFARTIPLPW